MNLATRCSNCATIFRIVEDQLKVSDGWVRCGRCDTVFDALEGMVDLQQQAIEGDEQGDAGSLLPRHDRSIAVAGPEPVDTRQLLVRRDDAPSDSSRPQATGVPLPDHGAGPAEPPLHSGRDDSSARPSAPAAGERGAVPAPAPDAAATAAPQPAAAPAIAASSLWAAAAQPPASSAAPPMAPPSFLQRAEREERWNTPAMRAALLGSSLILLLMLTVQILYHERDSIAARWPLAADVLRGACLRWDCSIEAPRNIREVTIVNSALTKLPGEAHSARLSVTLRNRSREQLAIPALELSLTDFEGRLIARKALLPSDFRVDPPIVAGEAELPLQIIVSAGEHRIAGYTVELFYP